MTDFSHISALPKDEGFDIIESKTFEEDIKSFTTEKLIALLKWHDERIEELFEAGCEDRGWECSDDGFDYRLQGAVAGGRKWFEAVLKDEEEPYEDEGAVHYPIYRILDERGVDYYY